jgi:hypothetical protein
VTEIVLILFIIVASFGFLVFTECVLADLAATHSDEDEKSPKFG